MYKNPLLGWARHVFHALETSRPSLSSSHQVDCLKPALLIALCLAFSSSNLGAKICSARRVDPHTRSNFQHMFSEFIYNCWAIHQTWGEDWTKLHMYPLTGQPI